jgi:hypothetical protein
MLFALLSSSDKLMIPTSVKFNPFCSLLVRSAVSLPPSWSRKNKELSHRDLCVAYVMFICVSFLVFWKNWLMTSWIINYLILGVDFYNIYFIFLYTKRLKISSRWMFQLLIYFFINLSFISDFVFTIRKARTIQWPIGWSRRPATASLDVGSVYRIKTVNSSVVL